MHNQFSQILLSDQYQALQLPEHSYIHVIPLLFFYVFLYLILFRIFSGLKTSFKYIMNLSKKINNRQNSIITSKISTSCYQQN